MGQNQSVLKPGVFRQNFAQAKDYNNVEYKKVTQAGTKDNQNKYENIVGITDQLNSNESDNFITYILILQCIPMDRILQTKSLVEKDWDFNSDSNGGNNIQNLTGLQTSLNGNSWYLSDRGRIEYKLETGQTNNNAHQVFKCLANWFNALDDIQNNYLAQITNKPTVSQSTIQNLVLQAEQVQRKYSEQYNNYMQLLLSKDQILSPLSDKRQLLMMNNQDLNQQRKIIVEINDKDFISRATLQNGEVLTSSGYDTSSQLKLGYYAYDSSPKNLSKYYNQGLYKASEIKKLWTFNYNGKTSILYYSKTNLSNTEVFHIIPVTAFCQLVKDAGGENTQTNPDNPDESDKTEGYSPLINSALNQLSAQNSDVGQMLNSPRMRQFKQNIEKGNIVAPAGKSIEGFKPIYK